MAIESVSLDYAWADALDNVQCGNILSYKDGTRTLGGLFKCTMCLNMDEFMEFMREADMYPAIAEWINRDNDRAAQYKAKRDGILVTLRRLHPR